MFCERIALSLCNTGVARAAESQAQLWLSLWDEWDAIATQESQVIEALLS